MLLPGEKGNLNSKTNVKEGHSSAVALGIISSHHLRCTSLFQEVLQWRSSQLDKTNLRLRISWPVPKLFHFGDELEM